MSDLARPSKFDRDEAVDTAMEIFWREGYEACSVKALSERLGITRSSFYNAFGSREELFREALTRYGEQAPDRAFARDPASAGSVRRLITQTFRAACHARATDPDAKGCFSVKSVAELCNRDEALGPMLDEMIQANVARLERLLEFGKATGELSSGLDPHATALALKTVLVGLNVVCKVIREEDELWLSARTALKALDLFEEDTAA
ncbi:TetR/AcrR family transcriptional regulator [Nisaea sp.]|uniref:TetR/AcrR family transcriptional regulator n=1 Tax=Nisaea sp. TaxID=2024842 RepID=UPI002B265057|nr:TetR/AcrR family transcriptional regulator [Nisaea sp.]